MKNIVITGSTRGIGLAMTLEFLQAGCNVTLSGRGEALSSEAQAALQPFEGKYLYIPCDVQEKEALQGELKTQLSPEEQAKIKNYTINKPNCRF